MIFNKKYFLAMFTALSMQTLFGINLANAVCEKELRDSCRFNAYPESCNAESQIVFKKRIEQIFEYESKESIIKNINHYTSLNRSGKYDGSVFATHAQYICEFKEALRQIDSPNRADSSQQSSSDNSSSSQANKKANQQATASQSNQASSSQPKPDPMGEMGDILGGVTETQTSSNSNNPSNTSNMKPEQAGLMKEASQTYATKTAAFEESHKGLKRTHNKDDEASRCLKMDGRQITNTCDFRVEYIFCAYNPDQNAFKAAFEMAAAFDCERRQMGMQGIRAKGKDAGTFTADAVYVFGCKDPSLPSGVTYERGRGLSGWCSE